MTQRAGSCAPDLGGQATGRPSAPLALPQPSTRGSPEPAFLNPVWKARSVSGKPAGPARPLRAWFVGLVLGAWGALLCEPRTQALLGRSPGPGTSLKVTAGEGWEISDDQGQRDPRAELAQALPVLEGIREDCRQVVTLLTGRTAHQQQRLDLPPTPCPSAVALALGQRGLFVSSCPSGQLRGSERGLILRAQGLPWGWTPTPGSASSLPLQEAHPGPGRHRNSPR